MGASGPKRSDRRPRTTLFAASRPADTRNVAPIATAPQPSADSRSGARTPSVPKRSAGRTTNQNASATRPLRKARTSAESGCGSFGWLARVVAAQPASPSEPTPTTPNDRARPDDGGGAAEDRAEERAADRGGERRADQGPAPAGGRRGDEPRERAGPREGAREPLAEPREHELPRVGRESEGDRRRRHAAQADEDRRLDAGPRGDDPARDRADERAERVGGLEHAGRRLVEVELVRVVGQQGCQRREEHRVDEDDRRDEEEQAAHGGESYHRGDGTRLARPIDVAMQDLTPNGGA